MAVFYIHLSRQKSAKKLTAKEKDELLLTLIEKVKELDSRMSILEKTVGGKDSSQINIGTANLSTTISSYEFTNLLRKSYDLINFQEKRGGLIPIPKLWDEMNKKGVSRSQFENELYSLEIKGVIDLQTAGDSSLIKDSDKSLKHHTRGLINYVVWRK